MSTKYTSFIGFLFVLIVGRLEFHAQNKKREKSRIIIRNVSFSKLHTESWYVRNVHYRLFWINSYNKRILLH